MYSLKKACVIFEVFGKQKMMVKTNDNNATIPPIQGDKWES